MLGVAVLPRLLGPSDEERRADEFRAGFIDGCSRQQPRAFCACLFETLSTDPAGDTMPELDKLFAEAQRTGVPPPPAEQAATRCAGG